MSYTRKAEIERILGRRAGVADLTLAEKQWWRETLNRFGDDECSEAEVELEAVRQELAETRRALEMAVSDYLWSKYGDKDEDTISGIADDHIAQARAEAETDGGAE